MTIKQRKQGLTAKQQTNPPESCSEALTDDAPPNQSSVKEDWALWGTG